MAIRLTGKKFDIQELVDSLGRVKAEKAEIAAREDQLVEQLKKLGVNEYHGQLFDAVVFEQNRSTTDWDALLTRYKIPPKVVARYTTVKPSLTCKVTARK